MIGISVKWDVKACTASLNNIAKKQIPFATRTALNDVAFQVQRAEAANMTAVFNHPRPFTAKATQVDKATATNPWLAVIFVRPEVEKYLEPYEFGGLHVLPGPELLNPKNVKLDPYGQLRRNQVKKIAAMPRVFFATIRGVTGFWQRSPQPRGPGSKAKRGPLKLLLRFGNAVPVKKHLRFHEIGVAVVRAAFVPAFKKAMANAIATAKKPTAKPTAKKP